MSTQLLTRMQQKLYDALMKSYPRPRSVTQLLQEIECRGDRDTLKVHVCNLRKHLKPGEKILHKGQHYQLVCAEAPPPRAPVPVFGPNSFR